MYLARPRVLGEIMVRRGANRRGHVFQRLNQATQFDRTFYRIVAAGVAGANMQVDNMSTTLLDGGLNVLIKPFISA